MIIYILKTILCSSLFLAAYYILLEKESIHGFKRLYLLFALISSFMIPFINITWTETPTLISQNYFAETLAINDNMLLPEYMQEDNNTVQRPVLSIMTICLYLVVTTFLMSRFLINLAKVIKTVQHNKENSINNEKAKLILSNNIKIPHSFFNWIFMNKNDYENGSIQNNILIHELTHVRQKHTFDIIFIEILICLFWFNPVFYLYRRAIKLNHEFLADKHVVNTLEEITSYQYQLINMASNNKQTLTSNFNYSITKKRLIMMTKNTTKIRACLSKLAVIPLALILVMIFCNKVQAENHYTTEAISTPEAHIENNEPIQDYYLPDALHFATSSAEINAEGLKLLEKVANHLLEKPKARLAIIGYADKNGGNESENKSIAALRSKNVATILSVKFNIDTNRLEEQSNGNDTQPFNDSKMNDVVLFYVFFEDTKDEAKNENKK